MKRVTARHRFVSKSYHDRRNSLEKQGVSIDEAKECGSASARKAGQIFDAKWPREEVANVEVSKSKTEKVVQNSKALAMKKPMKEVKKDNVIKKKKEQAKEKGASTEEKAQKSCPNSKDENEDPLDVW